MSPLTRREFIRLAGGAAAVCAFPNVTVGQDLLCISILHTTDLHGHILPTDGYDGQEDVGGLARCATQIRKWRNENPNSLLIDVGDFYQGTDVSLRDHGELMIDLFNMLKYDAWVVGNHEFDWGFDSFARAVQRSEMPVLGANIYMDGKQASDCAAPRVKCEPLVIKSFAGVNVAVIGITTPGMPFWFLQEFTGGLEFRHPVDPVRRAIQVARARGANAIVLAGHMGLKERIGGDDFANSVIALTTEFPEVVAFIAGHTHQPISSRIVRGALFTQADHFGIHAGKLDLWFDPETKKLIKREARCELMDERVVLDGAVMSRSKNKIDDSNRALELPIGRLSDALNIDTHPGAPSEVEQLIGASIAAALHERGVMVDGVVHGLFDETEAVAAGDKTVSDVWNILPYENFIVTAELLAADLRGVMEEIYRTHEVRNLIGFDVRMEGHGADLRVTDVAAHRGSAKERTRYTIAFNTFDARSGGHRFMRLRALLERPEAHCTLHPVQTRDALIQFFQRRGIISKSDLVLLSRPAAT